MQLPVKPCRLPVALLFTLNNYFEIDDQDRVFFKSPVAYLFPNQEVSKRMKPVGLYFVDQPLDDDEDPDHRFRNSNSKYKKQTIRFHRKLHMCPSLVCFST